MITIDTNFIIIGLASWAFIITCLGAATWYFYSLSNKRYENLLDDAEVRLATAQEERDDYKQALQSIAQWPDARTRDSWSIARLALQAHHKRSKLASMNQLMMQS